MAGVGEELEAGGGYRGGVGAVVFSPDGATLASGGGDETVRVWDAASGECRHTLAGHTGWVGSVPTMMI